MLADFLFVFFKLFTAILIIWVTTNCMINSKKIIILLPFFFSGILLCLSAVISFYGIFDQRIWFVVESSWAILFFWMFMNLRGKNGPNS